MELVNWFGLITSLIKVNLRIIQLKEEEHSSFLIKKFTMDNGKMVACKEKEL